MGRDGDLFDVLCEERTVRMLILPLGTVIMSLIMMVLAVREAHGEEQSLFISNGMNNQAFEPWSLWSVRYYIWHVLIFSVVSFKRRALPRKAWWVSDLTGFCLLLSLWSGYMQGPTFVPSRYLFEMHALYSGILMVAWVFETVIVWWPNPKFFLAYFFVSMLFIGTWLVQKMGWVELPDTGIPFVRARWEIFLEWVLVVTHFPVVWYRFPEVEAAMLDGTWQPYLPGFLGSLFPDFPIGRSRYQTMGVDGRLTGA